MLEQSFINLTSGASLGRKSFLSVRNTSKTQQIVIPDTMHWPWLGFHQGPLLRGAICLISDCPAADATVFQCCLLGCSSHPALEMSGTVNELRPSPLNHANIFPHDSWFALKLVFDWNVLDFLMHFSYYGHVRWHPVIKAGEAYFQ